MPIAQVFIFSISIIAFAGWCFSWLIHIVALIYGKLRLNKALPPLSPEDLPGVSIIKPLVGVDPNLFYNLESFFNLDYPAYELLFSVHDEQDPAIMVVQSLIERYPKVNAKLFIGVKYVGPNGKVNNMMKPFEAAKYDLIAISDSSIKAERDTLQDLVSHLTPDVGYVIQMPFTCDRKGFSSVYEQVFFGTMQARNTLSANSVGITCATGMSSLVRKEIIEKCGGLSHFSCYLAEDHMISEAAKEQGYRSVLSGRCAMQNSGHYSIDHFHKRLLRWGKLRSSMLPALIFLEPVSECMLQGIILSFFVEYLFGFSPLAFFLLHCLVWFISDYTLMKLVHNGTLPFSKFEFFAAWVMRECLSFYLSLKSHGGSTVTWRHRTYKVRWGGIIEEIR